MSFIANQKWEPFGSEDFSCDVTRFLCLWANKHYDRPGWQATVWIGETRVARSLTVNTFEEAKEKAVELAEKFLKKMSADLTAFKEKEMQSDNEERAILAEILEKA